MGAPVVAFCKIADQAIRSREPVTRPDAVIVQDPTLLHHVDLFAGLSLTGYVILNSSRSPGELGISELADRLPFGQVITVPATDLARRHTGRPLPNAALLGAFAALTGAVSPASVVRAIRERFPGRVGETNAAAAEAALAVAREKGAVSAADSRKRSHAQTD
jgi:pyruvate ferredoxin oxidoreductase gamma subunit